jgi:hypothetical protein
MSVHLKAPCVSCGRMHDARSKLCQRCRFYGVHAAALWCVCDEPKPEVVWFLGAVECSECHRPVLS